MKFALTKWQVARGARPDAELNGKMYLIKSASALTVTYQIQVLLHRAIESKRKLVLDVSKTCELSKPLKDLVKQHRRNLEISRR